MEPLGELPLEGQTHAKGRNDWFGLRRVAAVLYDRPVKRNRLHIQFWSRRAGRGEHAPIILAITDEDFDKLVAFLEKVRDHLRLPGG